jgi:hypothetical protein
MPLRQGSGQAVTGSCHCGAVRIAVPRVPEWVASCNCSICRRTGALVAYYPTDEVRVEGKTETYVTGDRFIRFHHCPTCACHTHWDANPEALAGDLPDGVRDALTSRMGINARLLDGFEMREGVNGAVPFLGGAELEVRFFDKAE